jgi:hypothetical protein
MHDGAERATLLEKTLRIEAPLSYSISSQPLQSSTSRFPQRVWPLDWKSPSELATALDTSPSGCEK